MTIHSSNAVDTCIGKIDMLDAAIRQYHISKEQLDAPSRKLEDIPEDILARFVAVAQSGWSQGAEQPLSLALGLKESRKGLSQLTEDEFAQFIDFYVPEKMDFTSDADNDKRFRVLGSIEHFGHSLDFSKWDQLDDIFLWEIRLGIVAIIQHYVKDDDNKAWRWYLLTEPSAMPIVFSRIDALSPDAAWELFDISWTSTLTPLWTSDGKAISSSFCESDIEIRPEKDESPRFQYVVDGQYGYWDESEETLEEAMFWAASTAFEMKEIADYQGC